MVSTFIDKMCKELKRFKLLELLKNENEIDKKIKKLDEILINFNITKCSLKDLDFYQENGSFYLIYLIQNDGIDFGICKNFKMWYNKNGEQRRCKLLGNKQVNCFGNKNKCELL